MTKQIIAVDIDDVLAAENEAMRIYMNEQYGFGHTPEDYQIEAPYWGYWNQVWGVDDQEGERRYQQFLNSGVKNNLEVHDSAIDVLTELKKTYELVIVTARGDALIEMTHDWLSRHFPDIFRSVEFVVTWSGDVKASKAVICKEIGAEYLIDDNLQHCTTAAEAGLEALLFGSYGWNAADVLPERVRRVADWQAVLEFFNGRG